MMPPLFATSHVSCRAAGRDILSGASLALLPGQLTIVIGPNGAGKTTLFKVMTGEVAPEGGEVLSGGERLSQIPPWRLACRRAVMGQSSEMPFPYRVYEVVRFGLEGIGRARSPESAVALVHHAMEVADCTHLADRIYPTLSGGEQQRVQFARAYCQLLAGESMESRQALFLDEPIASLDLCHQIGLMDAVKALVAQKQICALVILHDLNLATRYADQLVVMQAGKIVASGKSEAVLSETLLHAVFHIRQNAPERLPAGMPFVLPQFSEVSMR